MGTVLSFSPRENHPIYAASHHRGSGTMSTSSSADFSLNNYAYEQMNNVKNRENCTKTNIINNNNGSSLVLFGSSNSNIMNNNLTTTSMEERASDSARILSEKNAIEKNLKKHSLFINALSWKRLSSSHGKKKLESYNTKNKAANLTTSSFRPPALTDSVHPMTVTNEKNKNYQQQQIQFASNNNLNNNLNNINHVKDNLHPQSIYFSPGPKSLLALDLQNSNNANLQHHQHVEKLGPKLPLQLPLALQSNAMHHHQQQQQQQHFRPGPRKTIIQVSTKYELCIYDFPLHRRENSSLPLFENFISLIKVLFSFIMQRNKSGAKTNISFSVTLSYVNDYRSHALQWLHSWLKQSRDEAVLNRVPSRHSVP